MNTELIKYLSSFLTENRLKRFDEVIQHRTRHITVVLEDIFQPHNASAVLRSCDCFGIQDVHVIENNYRYTVNPDVELGSAKWITLHRYNRGLKGDGTEKVPVAYSGNQLATSDCVAELKKKNYKIIVTSPHKNDCTIDELDLTQKIALFFGSEKPGVSSSAFELADGFVKIPMVGFTESLNISVSAAVTLYTLTSRLKKSNVNWKLSEEEIAEIKLQWIKNSVPKAELLEMEFYKMKM